MTDGKRCAFSADKTRTLSREVSNNVHVGNKFVHTGPYGYKMRLELHPNGRNDGLNTHLSIFVRLMKSEYDGILPWPFDKKVTITLIDQQPCPKLRRNIHMCSYPRNDGHFSPCYSRPVEERAQNIAFGFNFANLLRRSSLKLDITS